MKVVYGLVVLLALVGLAACGGAQQKYALTAATACEWQVLLERQLSR